MKSNEICITLRGADSYLDVWIRTVDHPLARKWQHALNQLIAGGYHLEKNYCWMGWSASPRNGAYILDQVNASIAAINAAGIGYTINDHFDMSNCITDQPTEPGRVVGRNIVHNKLNRLHRYFEDLQGTSTNISAHYACAGAELRWHIRQLNLLCHEFESWALSYRKELEAPDWRCPTQLMCWLAAPRFALEGEDFDLFGINTLNRDTGGVYLGVNKAVGKHHWEVFNDEGRDSRIGELVTSTLKAQTEAAGDFDIEWGRNPAEFAWQRQKLLDFELWLEANGFDSQDPTLSIGHPRVAQVDLDRSFGTGNPVEIWAQLEQHLDVYRVSTSEAAASYTYHWSDPDYPEQQQRILK